MPGMLFSKRLTCVCQETDQTRDDNPPITGPDDPESVNLQAACTLEYRAASDGAAGRTYDEGVPDDGLRDVEADLEEEGEGGRVEEERDGPGVGSVCNEAVQCPHDCGYDVLVLDSQSQAMVVVKWQCTHHQSDEVHKHRHGQQGLVQPLRPPPAKDQNEGRRNEYKRVQSWKCKRMSTRSGKRISQHR